MLVPHGWALVCEGYLHPAELEHHAFARSNQVPLCLFSLGVVGTRHSDSVVPESLVYSLETIILGKKFALVVHIFCHSCGTLGDSKQNFLCWKIHSC